MKIVFFGTPEFAVSPFDKLISSDHEILAVVTQPDRKSGRGKKVESCAVKKAAISTGLEVIQPQRVRDSEFIDQLRRLAPSVIVVVAYGQILPTEILDLPGFGCVNIHASLLPCYRGAAPINWAIMNGEKRTGITTMLMDEGMDTGSVLLQEETVIYDDDTVSSLSDRLSVLGADLLIRTLKGLESGSIAPAPQPEGATYAPILKKTDGLIRWSKSAIELRDFVRGMNPWPGAYSFLRSERLKIHKVSVVESDQGSGHPGVIIRMTKNEFHVSTGSGTISILEIQPAGKPVMPVISFLQGRHWKEGMKFKLADD